MLDQPLALAAIVVCIAWVAVTVAWLAVGHHLARRRGRA